MSRDSYLYLKRYLNEKTLTAVLTIIQEHLTIDGIVISLTFISLI